MEGLTPGDSRKLIQFAFRQHPTVDQVVLSTIFVNGMSRQVMVKSGVRYVETIHLEFNDPLPGTELGEVLCEVTREGWEKGLEQALPGVGCIASGYGLPYIILLPSHHGRNPMIFKIIIGIDRA